MSYTQETEWQVTVKTDTEEDEVLTGLTKKQAEKEFDENPNATALIKVIWKEFVDNVNSKYYSQDASNQREDIIIKEKEV